jgi:lysophospholipase L1-like esterase
VIAAAEPRKIMIIGDSQSEEYRFELPFTAPASDPTESNTMNWIEILAEHRSEEFDFGTYKRRLFEWKDVRNAGYEYNWSIPGALTDTWITVLNASFFDDQEYLDSKWTLLDQVDEVEAVVIFLGGNDMSTVYSRLNRDERPPGWPESVIDQIEEIAEKVRDENSTIPIIIGTFPDVGGTEQRQNDFPNEAGRQLASTYIAEANQKLQTFADDEGFPTFDVAKLTLDFIDDAPYRIGNVEFLPFGHPENKPRNLLCRDGFHPSTASQAVIANMIIAALNEALNADLTPLSEEEILVDVLGMDSTIDDDYLAWINAIVPGTNSLLADPDGDGLENLGEFALDLNPLSSDMPALSPQLTFDYSVAESRRDYVSTRAAQSADLINWVTIPGEPPVTPTEQFLRLEFILPK